MEGGGRLMCCGAQGFRARSSFVEFSSTVCWHKVLVYAVIKKKKNPASLHILCLAPWMIEVAYRLHKRLSLQARRQQRTIVRLLSTTSGPRPVPGTWPGPNNMAYLNEQKGSGIVIAKSERAKEERGWEPVRA